MEDLGLGWLKHTRCLHCAQMTGQPPMEFINFVMLYDVVCSHVLFQGAAPAAKKRRRRGEIADKKTTYISLEDDIT